MNEKQRTKIINLGNSIRQYYLVCLIGIIVPIVLLLAVPASFLYIFQRRSFLAKLNAGEIPMSEADMEDSELQSRIDSIRKGSIMLYIPPVALVLLIVVLYLAFGS